MIKIPCMCISCMEISQPGKVYVRIILLRDSEFSVKGDYKESWLHIEAGMNFIERYTNLGICIMEELNKKNTEAEPCNDKPA